MLAADCLPGDLIVVNSWRTILVLAVKETLRRTDTDDTVPILYLHRGKVKLIGFDAGKKVKRINT